MKNHKVSIICAVRNELYTLTESLNSLVNQTYKNKEIIIIDDESIDGSTEVAKEFAKKYPFIKYYAVKHDNVVATRIGGIKRSTGDILFVIDADAIYEPDYVKKCIKHLDKKGVGGVLGKIRVWRKKNTFISKFKEAHYSIRWDDMENMKNEISQGKIPPWIFKRKIYDEIGGYNKEVNWSADVDFGKRMLAKGYKIVLEYNVSWWHRWKEGVFETIGNSLFTGRVDFGRKRTTKEKIKMAYYFVFPFIILASLFYPYFWWLVLLHAIPQFLKGVRLCRKAKKMHIHYSKYLLLFPVVSYISNVPHIYGYLSNYIVRP